MRARGQLRCGTYATVPGFSFVNSKGEMTGLDADLCRAVAAAVLGSRERQGWCTDRLWEIGDIVGVFEAWEATQ